MPNNFIEERVKEFENTFAEINGDGKFIKSVRDFLRQSLELQREQLLKEKEEALIIQEAELRKEGMEALSDMKQKIVEEIEQKVGLMRQWLNEDRIDNPDLMVTSEELMTWFKNLKSL